MNFHFTPTFFQKSISPYHLYNEMQFSNQNEECQMGRNGENMQFLMISSANKNLCIFFRKLYFQKITSNEQNAWVLNYQMIIRNRRQFKLVDRMPRSSSWSCRVIGSIRLLHANFVKSSIEKSLEGKLRATNQTVVFPSSSCCTKLNYSRIFEIFAPSKTKESLATNKTREVVNHWKNPPEIVITHERETKAEIIVTWSTRRNWNRNRNGFQVYLFSNGFKKHHRSFHLFLVKLIQYFDCSLTHFLPTANFLMHRLLRRAERR